MEARVRFSVVTDSGKVSFYKVSELENDATRAQLVAQILLWSQSIRELGIRYMVSERMGDESAKRAVIAFDNHPGNERAN